MTARELIDGLGSQPLLLVAILCAPPVATFLLGLVLEQEEEKPDLGIWRYAYTFLVYAVCVPGMLAAVLTAYSIFFTSENLLDVNLLVYGMPLASMGLTLALITRTVDLEEVPGFDRISGLMLMLAMTFVLVLALSKTRIWLLFGGSMPMLFGLVAGIFGLLKMGAQMTMGRPIDPPTEGPWKPGP